jgi:hypothetical protein
MNEILNLVGIELFDSKVTARYSSSGFSRDTTSFGYVYLTGKTVFIGKTKFRHVIGTDYNWGEDIENL